MFTLPLIKSLSDAMAYIYIYIYIEMFLAYDCNGANIERAEQTKMSAGNIEPNSTNSSGKKIQESKQKQRLPLEARNLL